MGPSGSGKSTLLTLVGALRSVQEGSLQVLGTEVRQSSEQRRVEIRRRIGFIFQSHNLVDSLTSIQNVALVLQLSEANPHRRLERAATLLDAVGLGHRLHHFPYELSGAAPASGHRQSPCPGARTGAGG